jgi:hypothetical protein
MMTMTVNLLLRSLTTPSDAGLSLPGSDFGRYALFVPTSEHRSVQIARTDLQPVAYSGCHQWHTFVFLSKKVHLVCSARV